MRKRNIWLYYHQTYISKMEVLFIQKPDLVRPRLNRSWAFRSSVRCKIQVEFDWTWNTTDLYHTVRHAISARQKLSCKQNSFFLRKLQLCLRRITKIDEPYYLRLGKCFITKMSSKNFESHLELNIKLVQMLNLKLTQIISRWVL